MALISFARKIENWDKIEKNNNNEPFHSLIRSFYSMDIPELNEH